MKHTVLVALLLSACIESPSPDRQPVVVGSKSSAASIVLSEIAAQRLEARGCTVERRYRVGDTRELDAALDAGRIDTYAEEFSAAYTKVLGRDIDGQNAAAEPEVRGKYIKRDLLWAPPMGAGDTAMVFRRSIDEKCRMASRSLMSLGFATTADAVKKMAGEVARGGDVTKIVRAGTKSAGGPK